MKQYLEALSYILENGQARGDRTGTGTINTFGMQMRFNLQEGFPLVTTKKVPIRLIIEELLWFLRGSTNNGDLFNKNVHIWTAWALSGTEEIPCRSRAQRVYGALAERKNEKEIYELFISGGSDKVLKMNHDELDTVIKQYMLKDELLERTRPIEDDGELGPIYGAQWRSWPGRLMNGSGDPIDMMKYTVGGEGKIPMGYGDYDSGVYQEPIDQIAEVIKNLRERPFSRRHVVSAWNPTVLPDESISPQDNVRQGRQALASCHCLFQFSVSERDIADIRAEAGEALWSEFSLWQLSLVEGKDYKGSRLNIDYSNVSMRWLESKGVRTKRLSCQLYQR